MNTELPSSRLEGRVALVTGGAGGIGSAVCRALAARGATVAVHYRSKADEAMALVEQLRAGGGEAAAFSADLTQPGAASQLVEAVIARFGGVHILVNNAGAFTEGGRVEEMSDAVWDESLNINLSAVFRCSRACVPSMRAAGWGRIVNITSQAAFTGSNEHAHYAASKAALSGFTYSLAKEVAREGITVNLVSPGRILTPMLTDHLPGREAEWLAATPAGRFGRPEEVAAPIAFLASDEAGYITGATLHVNGGILMG